MMKTRVKMCGITNLEDALIAVEYGADALGFVFYPPSPRYINAEDAAKIIRQLPPFITSVGLFVDEDEMLIRQAIEQTSLDLLQFHGNEEANFCQQFSRPYIKAIRMQKGRDIHQDARDYSSALALLLDTYVKGIPGGTGESFNWNSVPKNIDLPIILAGGLKPENISQAIETVNPYAVDVSGGIEGKAGVKSLQKIIDFMSQVKGK